jgi:pyruvate dehydrogenase E2 component (dihydrolipoamide acetyltransferase)
MAEFVMPQLGADMTAGKLLRWRKNMGDRILRGDIIADVETDKADIEIEVFTAGVIEKFLVQPG